jgi:hypothetical protein
MSLFAHLASPKPSTTRPNNRICWLAPFVLVVAVSTWTAESHAMSARTAAVFDKLEGLLDRVKINTTWQAGQLKQGELSALKSHLQLAKGVANQLMRAMRRLPFSERKGERYDAFAQRHKALNAYLRTIQRLARGQSATKASGSSQSKQSRKTIEVNSDGMPPPLAKAYVILGNVEINPQWEKGQIQQPDMDTAKTRMAEISEQCRQADRWVGKARSHSRTPAYAKVRALYKRIRAYQYKIRDTLIAMHRKGVFANSQIKSLSGPQEKMVAKAMAITTNFQRNSRWEKGDVPHADMRKATLETHRVHKSVGKIRDIQRKLPRNIRTHPKVVLLNQRVKQLTSYSGTISERIKEMQMQGLKMPAPEAIPIEKLETTRDGLPKHTTPRGLKVEQILRRGKQKMDENCMYKNQSFINFLKVGEKEMAKYDGPERLGFMHYYREKLIKRWDEDQKGVAGVATFPEIATRKAKFKTLAFTLPNKPKINRVDILRFVAEMKAYKVSNLAEHTYLKKLAGNNCLFMTQAAKLRGGTKMAVNGMSQYRDVFRTGRIQTRVNKHTSGLFPNVDFEGAYDSLDKKRGKERIGIMSQSSYVGNVADLHKRILDNDMHIQLMPAWAELYDGKKKERLASIPERMKLVQQKLKGLFAEQAAKLHPPPQVKNRKANGLARRLAGKGAFATSTIERKINDREELVKMVSATKALMRKWKEIFDVFEMMWVQPTKGPDPWIHMGSNLRFCDIFRAAGIKYLKGRNVRKGRWLTEEEDHIGRVLCPK